MKLWPLLLLPIILPYCVVVLMAYWVGYFIDSIAYGKWRDW